MNSLSQELSKIRNHSFYGKVTSIQGLLVSVVGIDQLVSIGSRCIIETRSGEVFSGEVIGFKDNQTLVMSFYDLEGVGLGCRVIVEENDSEIYPNESWLGRVLNPMGEPIDGKGPLIKGDLPYKLRSSPPLASERSRLGKKIDLGVRSINTFVTCCRGQRMGIFSGSGVGKSVLLSMMAKYTKSDINIIGLVGERGREVQEFIEDHLGSEGLAKSIIIVATSDESALLRRQAGYLTLTLSEYFRDKEKDVLCLIDSITRFAQAQREIGLSGGEPPASKGYTPTVFAELPKLLERAGPGKNMGNITGLFTVLVEGDDHNEPISDAVRAIVDGHIVLEREIMERGRYPAINILKSVSRSMPNCNNTNENELITRAKTIVSLFEKMSEMIRLGAYKKGSDQDLDQAIEIYPLIENFLSQKLDEKADIVSDFTKLEKILKVTSISQEV